MPRKQRFKPSRKPQSTQGTVPSQQVDDRKDINPEHRTEQHHQAGRATGEDSVIKGDSEVE